MKLLAFYAGVLSLAGCGPKASDVAWERTKECAAQAEITFRGDGYKPDADPKTGAFASFRNHFNAERGKCFMEVTSQGGSAAGGSVNKALFDAYEGKEYG